MVERSDWNGLIAGSRTDDADLTLVMPLLGSASGGSGAFLCRADDGLRYWVKPLNNGQGPRIPITDQIVGRAGGLLGGPFCVVRTISISDDFAGLPFRPGLSLEPGIAHGSLNVSGAVECRMPLGFRRDDDNRLRHCFILALYDWCWGDDPQWLRVPGDRQRYYSHDHGHYFPPRGAGWTASALKRDVDVPREFPDGDRDFDLLTGPTVAERLRNVRREDLVALLAAIPASWPVSDSELESVGFFLERRAAAAAARLLDRLGAVS